MYHPTNLNAIEQLQKNNLLYPEQRNALSELEGFVKTLEVVTGLSFPKNPLENSPSYTAKVDEKTLQKIENYLHILGLSYTKNETQLIFTLYDETHLHDHSSSLFLILSK